MYFRFFRKLNDALLPENTDEKPGESLVMRVQLPFEMAVQLALESKELQRCD